MCQADPRIVHEKPLHPQRSLFGVYYGSSGVIYENAVGKAVIELYLILEMIEKWMVSRVKSQNGHVDMIWRYCIVLFKIKWKVRFIKRIINNLLAELWNYSHNYWDGTTDILKCLKILTNHCSSVYIHLI